MLRILLDTSFILPILGIDTGITVRKVLEELDSSSVEIYYSRFSILEAIWVATKLIRKGSLDADRFFRGLRSIYASNRLMTVDEDPFIFEYALKLYMIGHKDIIDNILYSTALHKDLKFLTSDEELVDFIKSKGLNRNVLLLPRDINVK